VTRPLSDVCLRRDFGVYVSAPLTTRQTHSKDAFIMKQSAAKTLGVAVVGAAIAAAGAGAAHAAPSAPVAPEASQALGTVTQALPVENVTKALPTAAGALAQGRSALGAGLEAAQPAAANVLAEGPTAPVAGLLGGLPVGKTLPTKGLGVNGLPLGGA
jgi:hypothetical protein